MFLNTISDISFTRPGTKKYLIDFPKDKVVCEFSLRQSYWRFFYGFLPIQYTFQTYSDLGICNQMDWLVNFCGGCISFTWIFKLGIIVAGVYMQCIVMWFMHKLLKSYSMNWSNFLIRYHICTFRVTIFSSIHEMNSFHKYRSKQSPYLYVSHS